MKVHQSVRVVRGGNVQFGSMEDSKGICAIALPMFSMARCKIGPLTRAIQKINNSPRLYQDSLYEKQIKKAIGDPGTQIIVAKGQLVALTQQAATKLLGLGLKIAKDSYLIPVWKEAGEIKRLMLWVVFYWLKILL